MPRRSASRARAEPGGRGRAFERQIYPAKFKRRSTLDSSERVDVTDCGADATITGFEVSISAELIRAIADRQPLRAVFRDSAFASDSDRINADQVFAEVSPATEVKTI